MLRTKRKPLVNLREWGRRIRVSKNARLNEKSTGESEDSMTFSEPVNEPPSPTYAPVFSPLEEEEDEVKEAITTHTTMREWINFEFSETQSIMTHTSYQSLSTIT